MCDLIEQLVDADLNSELRKYIDVVEILDHVKLDGCPNNPQLWKDS